MFVSDVKFDCFFRAIEVFAISHPYRLQNWQLIFHIRVFNRRLPIVLFVVNERIECQTLFLSIHVIHKKVLLRDRKRLTANSIASNRSPVWGRRGVPLSWLEGKGVPLVLAEGTLSWLRYPVPPPRPGTGLGGIPLERTWDLKLGYTPPRKDLGP